MRWIVLAVCLLLSGLVFSLPVSASGMRMQRHYSISITVECLEAALETLRDLPGYNLNSNVTNVEPHTGRPVRQASFTRRVDAWAFRHMQAVLRDMGEVTTESENAWHMGGEWASLETRIRVLTQEIERLSIMMAASNTLHVLIAIDNQLSRVSWERDRLMGRRNQILAESESVVMYIWLSEETEYIRPEAPGFGTRVTDSFLRSWNALLRNAGNFTVFMARVSIPFVIWLAAGAVILVVCIKIKKMKFGKPKPAETEGTEEGAVKDEE
ncbi:MAG: DUF4349 domain-containing protein [Defluviitaleaceae bacterium]|nr:DUF4349 domain-containing protein [Defluviitaleaceae bacterium]